jgi:hypothetical protein
VRADDPDETRRLDRLWGGLVAVSSVLMAVVIVLGCR